ncbi:MAG: hypothetical protein M5R40_14240 [Anaerolineae bacterium]|nr:hypothetical protein [Anaerolineae bacterium]
MHLDVALLGFGNVGRALARLLLEKAPTLQADFGLTFTVNGIATRSRGQVIDARGVDLAEALDLVARDGTVEGCRARSLQMPTACSRLSAPALPT